MEKVESKVNSDTIQTWNDNVDSKLQAADVESGGYINGYAVAKKKQR